MHCPIRYPSRDITKTRFIRIKPSSDGNKWHYCDAALNFANFDLKKLVFEPHTHTNGKSAPFGKTKNKQLMVAYVFFGSLHRSYLSNKNKKKKRSGFPFVGGCMINTVLKNHLYIRKLSGAKQRLCQHLGWPSSYRYVYMYSVDYLLHENYCIDRVTASLISRAELGRLDTGCYCSCSCYS